MKTKLFLDSGNPEDTRVAIETLGFLDGQTTNPSLIAKNPKVQDYKTKHGAFTLPDLLAFYRDTVQAVSALIPSGSVSIEVPASATSTSDEMYALGVEMYGWIPNAHIKFPITKPGLAAAAHMSLEGKRVNMTLCFSQAQAAAVYAATSFGKKEESLLGYKNVFVSPFIGRLDDIGQKGLDLIVNTQRMYANGDHHVAILAASIRNPEHMRALLAWGVDIVTAPLNVIQAWVAAGKPMTQGGAITKLKAIPYQTLDLNQSWVAYDFFHPLTDKGLEKFREDWEGLL